MRSVEGKIYPVTLRSTESQTSSYWIIRRAFTFSDAPVEKRLSADVHYVNLAKLTSAGIDDCLKKVKRARAIVLDLRHYPVDFDGWTGFISHLISKPVVSLPMYIHHQTLPGQKRVNRELVLQSLNPQSPLLGQPAVALSSRYTVSQGEQALGFIQAAGIPILGERTYGANGDINSVDLAGGSKFEMGLTITFTGLEVRQRDGSKFVGVGISPDLPISRTQEGIRQGRDEQLEFARCYLETKLRSAKEQD
jgi:C-terminal processing protease CtpA/Prc